MSAHDHHPVEVDPASLKSAQAVWSGFTHMAKYGIIGVVTLLLLMAIFLV